jgi:hypothetical protein
LVLVIDILIVLGAGYQQKGHPESENETKNHQMHRSGLWLTIFDSTKLEPDMIFVMACLVYGNSGLFSGLRFRV